MDYKELIEQLRSASPFHGSWLRDRMEEAATAIETLLAERDAALRAHQTTPSGTYVSIEWFKAVQAELDALKAKQTAKLDRSRWEECFDCCLWERSHKFCPYCVRHLLYSH